MSDYVISSEKFCLNSNVEYVVIDDITYARYKSTASTRLCNMNVTTNMLIIILEGSKYAYRKPGERLVINKNEAFFLPRGTHLVTELVSELNQFRSLVFFIEDHFISEFIKKYVKDGNFNDEDIYKPKIFKIDTVSSYFETLQASIPFFMEQKSFKSDLFKIKLEEILVMMLSTEEGDTFFKNQRRLMRNGLLKLSEVMEMNYLKSNSIEEFASESGKSLSSFKRDFKKIYNIPPKKWLVEKRLDQAFMLLENTDFNITDICYKSGFSNLSYFIQVFKKRFSCTPKQMKMNLKQH